MLQFEIVVRDVRELEKMGYQWERDVVSSRSSLIVRYWNITQNSAVKVDCNKDKDGRIYFCTL